MAKYRPPCGACGGRIPKNPRQKSGRLRKPTASQAALVVKNLPANVRDIRDTGSIPGSGRSPGEQHGNSLKYSSLENPMDRGAWQAAVRVVAELNTTEATWHTCG